MPLRWLAYDHDCLGLPKAISSCSHFSTSKSSDDTRRGGKSQEKKGFYARNLFTYL